MEKFYAQHLNDTEINAFSKAVHSGYWAVNEIFKIYPFLGNFLPGYDIRPNLINVAVQFELCKMSVHGFQSKIQKNAAGNCNHLVLLKDGLQVTTHYLGSTKPRKMARSAICREPYAAANNMDLFADFCAEDNVSNEHHLYCHLYHSGKDKPEFVALAAPNNRQTGIIGNIFKLPIIQKEELEKTEEIKETIEHTLKVGVAQNEHQQFEHKQFKESNG